MQIVALLIAVFKFFDEVQWFVQLLQKTPQEKRQQAIAEVHAAFTKASTSGGDTSDIEKTISDF